jgi:hypothetical protein
MKMAGVGRLGRGCGGLDRRRQGITDSRWGGVGEERAIAIVIFIHHQTIILNHSQVYSGSTLIVSCYS